MTFPFYIGEKFTKNSNLFSFYIQQQQTGTKKKVHWSIRCVVIHRALERVQKATFAYKAMVKIQTTATPVSIRSVGHFCPRFV